MTPARSLTLTCHPATPERWTDLVGLFGARGACGGCWCMWWRKPRGAFNRDKGETNKEDLCALVTDGPPPGLIGYHAGAAIAWVAIAPRPAYPVADRSRIARLPNNDAIGPGADIWLVSCLYVARPYRRCGVSKTMVRYAVAYAAARGADAVDAVPVEPTSTLPDAFVWTGPPSTYRDAGFVEIARPGPHRPLFRAVLTGR